MNALNNRLLDLLGIDLPIIQAPMAGVSTPHLAAEVSNSGGLGSLGLGASNVEAAREMVQKTRAGTTRAFNVNLFCHASACRDANKEAQWLARLSSEFRRHDQAPPAELHEIYRSFIEDEAMFQMLLEERPPVVSFHFGLPAPDRIKALKDAGMVILASVTSLDEARQVEAAGSDAVVAQGWEAGGHRGVFDASGPDTMLGITPLVRCLVHELSLPVIAAGGIMDGAGIRAMLELGAHATQLGTALVACDESNADAGYRAALSGKGRYHTVMTRVISGRPARALNNRFTEWGRSIPDDEVPAYSCAYDAGKALHAAAKAKGEEGYGAQWAGQGAPLVRPMPAAKLVCTLAMELSADS